MAKILGYLKYQSLNGVRIKLPLTDEYTLLDLPCNYPPTQLTHAYLLSKEKKVVSVEGFNFKYTRRKKRR